MERVASFLRTKMGENSFEARIFFHGFFVRFSPGPLFWIRGSWIRVNPIRESEIRGILTCRKCTPNQNSP